MKCLSIIIIIISSLICCIRTESFTYFAIRDQWENSLLSNDPTISLECSSALNGYKEELKRPTITWALRMLDATTKLQPGILYGNVIDYGSFDECLEIEGVLTADNNKTVVGKHCFTSFFLKDILKDEELIRDETALLNLVWSICVPDLCSADDLSKLFKKYQLTFKDEHCQTKYYKAGFDTGDILASVFFGLLLLIFLLSTTYDIYLHYTKTGTKHAILTAFSAFTNGKKLLTVNNNPNQLKCLDGMRFISMLWIVLMHEFSMMRRRPIFNSGKFDEWIHKPISMYISGDNVAVDTFFLLSGIVMTYVFFVATEKGVKFNIFKYYIHRYLRLTPTLIPLIIIHLSFVKYFGSGPLWPEASKMFFIEPCKKGWWEHLLYIQNYVNVADACIPQSWYLAADMHLYLISPIILLSLKKWPKCTIAGVILAAIGSILWGYILAWNNEWIGLMIGEDDPNGTSLQMQGDYYIKTHTRASPWLIGLILGYVIFKHKNFKRPKINKVTLLSLWIMALTILAACIFGGHNLTIRKPYNRFENSAFLAFVRPAWAIGLCWVIYACLFGYGGPINAFLSWSLFQIGSRFTYNIYVIHYTFLVISSTSSRLPIYISDYKLIHEFIGDITIIFIIAVFWTLFFESPFIVIERVLFGKIDKKVETTRDNAGGEIKIDTQQHISRVA